MRGKSLLWALAFGVGTASWAQVQQLSLSFAPDVVRVDAAWPGKKEEIVNAIQAGGMVSVQWRFVIERVRAWWLPDETVGEITVVRMLRPDPLSGRFLLIERPSGVVWELSSLRLAVERLLHLQRFPLLDRSLLRPGERYRIRLELLHFDGAPPEGWWARLWLAPEYRMEIELRAP